MNNNKLCSVKIGNNTYPIGIGDKDSSGTFTSEVYTDGTNVRIKANDTNELTAPIN